jgi:hypothetical protein
MTFLLNLIKTIGVSLLSKTFGIWLLKLAAKTSTTKVDDNAVLLIEAGLASDAAGIEKAAKAILQELSEKYVKE